jgi:hypothetical protein
LRAAILRDRPQRHFGIHRLAQGTVAQIWSNNPQKRSNREIRWCTDVVGIFPSREALIRLIGTELGEQHNEWAEGARYLRLDVLSRSRLTKINTCRSPPRPPEGVRYYRNALRVHVPGLMRVQFGDYHIADIQFVAAFDVDSKKGVSIWRMPSTPSENNTIAIADLPRTDVIVQRGPTLDGLGDYYRRTIVRRTPSPLT